MRADMASGTMTQEIEITDQKLPGFGVGTSPDRGDDGQPPFREPDGLPAIDAARLGMLIFLGAETMLFAGFITAFLVFRLGVPVWPPPFQPRLPVAVTGVNTGVLLLSGYTMWLALAATRRANLADLIRRLAQTALLGIAFLGVQGYEWGRLIEFGLTAPSGVYGGTFYALIGAHALHLLGALVWLSVVLVQIGRRRNTAEYQTSLSVFGMYWYFVVALWPLLYPRLSHA